jgi:hypothetical protein
MRKPNIVLAICLLVCVAAADELTWELPTEDINGNYIDSRYLTTSLYWRHPNDEWVNAGVIPGTSLSLLGADAGCYHIRLTATRTDTTPHMESLPSNEVYYCTPTELPPNPPTAVGTD